MTHLDMQERLKYIASLKPGWYDGEGAPFSEADVAWLETWLTAKCPNSLIPYIYPTANNRILLEWSDPVHECSLEIDMTTKMAYWHRYSVGSVDVEDNVDLASLADRESIMFRIRQIYNK